MHKPEFLIENETHKILWNFDIQTDPQILTRKLNLGLINKKGTCHFLGFAASADHTGEIKEKILELCHRIEKTVEYSWGVRNGSIKA